MTLPALFNNHRETVLTSVVTLVEEALSELDHPTAQASVPADGALHHWRIGWGSAEVSILIIDQPDGARLRLRSAVMQLPSDVDRAAAFGHLLELNLELWGAAFACKGLQVLLTSERPILDLDRSEVVDLVRYVRDLADLHDDALVARFGGELGGSF